MKEEQFIEQLTEQLSLDILEVLKENVVDINNDVFLRDLAIAIESIKSLLIIYLFFIYLLPLNWMKLVLKEDRLLQNFLQSIH